MAEAISTTSNTATVGASLAPAAAPIIVADDDEVAEPVTAAEAVQHINPIEAAKELRQMIKQLQSSGLPNEATKEILLAFDYLKKSRTQMTSALNNLVYLRDWEALVIDAINKRLVVSGREAMRKVSDHRHRVQIELLAASDNSRSSYLHLERARNHLSGAGATPGGALNKLLDRMHVLVQSLPTVTNAPQAPAEMVLRAVETILKNGGYGNFVNWQEVIVNDNGTSEG